MSIKFVLYCCLSLITFSSAFGQSYYSAAAEGGLFARSTPSLTAPRTGKFACGENVILLKETNEFIEIKDSTTNVKGYWVQVKSANGLVGYLCKGYLLEKHQDLDYHNYCEEEYGSCSAKPSTKDYQLYLHNYQISNGGVIGEMDLRDRFRWLTASRSTIIQRSIAHAGLCEDPEAELEKLFEAFVR